MKIIKKTKNNINAMKCIKYIMTSSEMLQMSCFYLNSIYLATKAFRMKWEIFFYSPTESNLNLDNWIP